MTKPLFILFFILTFFSRARAVDFEKHFADSTLRLDYIFSGDRNQQHINIDRMHILPGWFGRRVNLETVPVKGHGRIFMRDIETGDTIYKESFSHLFIEWLETDEAGILPKAMDNVLLVPMPKKAVDITVQIDNSRQVPSTTLTHRVNPDDILIRKPVYESEYPSRYIHKSGDPKEKIDVAILAEGFTVAEMDSFYRAAETAVDAILSHEPFNQYKDRFNFVAVATTSKDSGVSVPRKNEWKNTAFSSHFGTFYSDRYLTTSNIRDIHDALTGIPYEHIIILANTPEYGGGGIHNNGTLTSAGHPTFRPVVVHEFGHSFGALTDEYFYPSEETDSIPSDLEPWEQNITTLVNFESKWKDMLPEGTPIPGTAIAGDETTIGVYEGGGGRTKGVYRPVDSCRMRYNTAKGFCPVCQRALTRTIEHYAPSRK